MKDLAFLQLGKIKQEVQSPSPYTHTHTQPALVMSPRSCSGGQQISWQKGGNFLEAWPLQVIKKSMMGERFKAPSFIRQAVVAFMSEVSFPAILTRRVSLWFSHGGQRSRYPSQPAGSLFRPLSNHCCNPLQNSLTSPTNHKLITSWPHTWHQS